jgi:hypothetical protein
MTGMNHQAQLVCKAGVSLTFFPGWPQTVNLLIFTSQVAGIKGLYYHTLPKIYFLLYILTPLKYGISCHDMPLVAGVASFTCQLKQATVPSFSIKQKQKCCLGVFCKCVIKVRNQLALRNGDEIISDSLNGLI